MTSSADSTDLLGCFEQLDLNRIYKVFVRQLSESLRLLCSRILQLPQQQQPQLLMNEKWINIGLSWLPRNTKTTSLLLEQSGILWNN